MTYFENRGPDLEQAKNMADINRLIRSYTDLLPLKHILVLLQEYLFSIYFRQFIKTQNTDTKSIRVTFMYIAEILSINNQTLLCRFH